MNWADEVGADDLIESSADAHDSSWARLGGEEASTAPEVPASTYGAILGENSARLWCWR